MTSDFASFWLGPSTTQAQIVADGKTNNPWDAFCWVALGCRYPDGSWPHEDNFFRGACR